MNRLSLVTNATAKSICRDVMIYLNEIKLSPQRIIEIKTKFNFKKNKNSGKFYLNDLVSSFTEKNIYFLELFKYLKEENRYLNFLENLELKSKIPIYFKSISDIKLINENFQNRKVYHTSIFCKWMKHDYDDGVKFEKNTGVFADEIISTKSEYYKVSEDYLTKLELRECSICKKINSLKIGLEAHIDNSQIIKKILESKKNIAITFDLLKNELIYKSLIKASKNISIEIYIKEAEWSANDINYLLDDKFILRLIHNSFSFFNSDSMILLDNELFFSYKERFFSPNKDYIDISVYNFLKFNTISLTNDIAINSNYAYYVPVKHITSSNDDIFGEQSIVQVESYGLEGFIVLKCHFSYVPDKIFGFWQSKLTVHTNGEIDEDDSHNYFDFICLDPNLIEYL